MNKTNLLLIIVVIILLASSYNQSKIAVEPVIWDKEVHLRIESIHRHINELVCYGRAYENANSHKATKAQEYIESLLPLTDDENLKKDLMIFKQMLDVYANCDKNNMKKKEIVELAEWMHRIIHDLDYQGQNGAKYYGATITFEGDKAKAKNILVNLGLIND